VAILDPLLPALVTSPSCRKQTTNGTGKCAPVGNFRATCDVTGFRDGAHRLELLATRTQNDLENGSVSTDPVILSAIHDAQKHLDSTYRESLGNIYFRHHFSVIKEVSHLQILHPSASNIYIYIYIYPVI
jgi:hypothetical protein